MDLAAGKAGEGDRRDADQVKVVLIDYFNMVFAIVLVTKVHKVG